MSTFYILHNSQIDKYYIGSTQDIAARLDEHNKTTHKKKYTRKQPGGWVLVYSEEYADVSDARKRERQVKKWKSRKLIEKLVEQSRR